MSTALRESRPLPPPRGVLRAPRPDGMLDGERRAPPAALAEYVHHVWRVCWSLRAPFTSESLGHPAAQILFVDAGGARRAQVWGVRTTRAGRRLSGEGQTFGITFRPAMFAPLWRASMAVLTDDNVPLSRALGSVAKTWGKAMHEAHDFDAKLQASAEFLAPLLPEPNAEVRAIRDLVERVAADRAMVRVEDLVDASGFDARALQRAFRKYVGVSPKCVIQRYRLHEAAARLAAPRPPPLAALAVTLGYADQAHFSRDFKRAVGVTPQVFTARARSR